MLRLTVLRVTRLLNRLLRIDRLLVYRLSLRNLLITLIRLRLYGNIDLSGLGNNTLNRRPYRDLERRMCHPMRHKEDPERAEEDDEDVDYCCYPEEDRIYGFFCIVA